MLHILRNRNSKRWFVTSLQNDIVWSMWGWEYHRMLTKSIAGSTTHWLRPHVVFTTRLFSYFAYWLSACNTRVNGLSLHKKRSGEMTFENLSNIHFLFIFFFYIFTPSALVVEIVVVHPAPRGASCFHFRRTHTDIGLLFFRFRFDTVWIRRALCFYTGFFILPYFIYCIRRNARNNKLGAPLFQRYRQCAARRSITQSGRIIVDNPNQQKRFQKYSKCYGNRTKSQQRLLKIK